MAEESANPERISEAEQAVMEALWARAPLTANEVADYYEVETRTVIRWRNTIRQAQLAS